MSSSSILTIRRPSILFTRATKIHDAEKETPSKSPAPARDHPKPPALLDFEDLPEWYQDNPLCRSHYRPVSNSSTACIHSWTYLHNESLNIFTHLIPFLCSIALQYTLQVQLTSHFPHASLKDRLVFALYLSCASVTLCLSAGYHTLINHSFPVSSLWLRIDYVGILVLIMGSFFSGIYVGFYHSPAHLYAYWSMILVLCPLTSILVLHPKLQGLSYRGLRTAAFIATALSGFVPIGNGIWLYGWQGMWERSGMPYWFGEALVYSIAAFFFVTRFPESIWPGKFDIWLGSHQIFHVLVVVASVVHIMGVWNAYAWNYSHFIQPL